MKRALQCSATVLLLGYFGNCFGAEGYYARFLSLGGTNYSGALYSGGRGEPLESPLLVDETNTAPKLTKSKLSEVTLRPQVAVAGVRLGMTMEQVVSAWGKPRMAGLYNHGAPILSYVDSLEYGEAYAETDVLFSPGSNSVMAIWVNFSSYSDRPGLSPKVEDCLRLLGEPAARNYSPNPFEPDSQPRSHWYCRMAYKQPPLVLYSADGRLMALEVNPQAEVVARKGKGFDDYSIGFCHITWR
jgi:hypothetical protein